MSPKRHLRHLAGVFADQASAEATIGALRENGLDEARLGLLMHLSGDETLTKEAHHISVEEAKEAGLTMAPVGLIADLTVFTVGAAGIVIGVSGVFVAAFGGGTAGGLIGGWIGDHEAKDEREAAKALEELPLGAGEIMVFVNAPDDDTHLWTDSTGEMEWGSEAEEVINIFERCAARVVEVGPDHVVEQVGLSQDTAGSVITEVTDVPHPKKPEFPLYQPSEDDR